MKHLLFSLILIISSCLPRQKVVPAFQFSNYGNWPHENTAYEFENYLIVPLDNGKFALTNSLTLCEIISHKNSTWTECSTVISEFYRDPEFISIELVSRYRDVYILNDKELWKSSHLTKSTLLKSVAYENCSLITDDLSLNEIKEKIAVLINFKVIFVRNELSGFYELAALSCEERQGLQ